MLYGEKSSWVFSLLPNRNHALKINPIETHAGYALKAARQLIHHVAFGHHQYRPNPADPNFN
jgi:hypothetical protein